mmetsp:Transcript_1808/g.3933  ORF Transcript_1808/g.3933 Transcript_1808/m.3933 type:complete len:375 (-) Transcript_1808:952-2076(-)
MNQLLQWVWLLHIGKAVFVFQLRPTSTRCLLLASCLLRSSAGGKALPGCLWKCLQRSFVVEPEPQAELRLLPVAGLHHLMRDSVRREHHERVCMWRHPRALALTQRGGSRVRLEAIFTEEVETSRCSLLKAPLSVYVVAHGKPEAIVRQSTPISATTTRVVQVVGVSSVAMVASQHAIPARIPSYTFPGQEWQHGLSHGCHAVTQELECAHLRVERVLLAYPDHSLLVLIQHPLPQKFFQLTGSHALHGWSKRASLPQLLGFGMCREEQLDICASLHSAQAFPQQGLRHLSGYDYFVHGAAFYHSRYRNMEGVAAASGFPHKRSGLHGGRLLHRWPCHGGAEEIRRTDCGKRVVVVVSCDVGGGGGGGAESLFL